MAVLIAFLLSLLTLHIQGVQTPLATQQQTSVSPTPVVILDSQLPLHVAPVLPTPASEDKSSWGEIVKTGEHTYQIKVKNDEKMGTPAQILDALNELRKRNGAQPLKTDDKLCAYTQSRADYFNKIKNIDEHKGFADFVENQNGFEKLGYGQVGENSSYGYIMSGVHLIEFVYMRSPEHNKNQLDSKWDHACVGVSGSATNLIFATSPL